MTVTILLSTFAVLTVGSYLSSVIADGLYEQRRDRVLEEATGVRTGLTETLTRASSGTSTQQQDALTGFVQSVTGTGGTDHRDIAVVPVDEVGGLFPVSSDRQLLEEVDEEVAARVAAEPEALVWASVSRPDASGAEHPAILVGTRVTAAGSGAVDLYLVYSLEEEQSTLAFVQRVMLAGGLILLAILVGIAVVVARLVTAPLHRTALTAERIAAGDLSSRLEVAGVDEIARLGASFNRMAHTLEQKVVDLTQLSHVQQRFVSDVSHELRTPLTTIKMAASVLASRRDDLDPDLTRTVELLDTQVVRFDGLLADLLEISRYDAGAAVLEAHKEELDDIVLQAVDDVRTVAQARGCQLEMHLAGEGTEAVMDPRRVDRILRNLLTNAIEHGQGRPVLIHTAADEQAVAVTVQDQGVGISPEDAARVFDRFWRADPSRARTLGGTGLGLAISVEDAQLHGGWLQAWGQEGQGAVFRLTLPRRPGMTLHSSPLPLERPLGEDGGVTPSVDDRHVDPSALPQLEEGR